MLCSICHQKDATVHMTQIRGDKMQKADLCGECAKQNGVNDPAGISLADLLSGDSRKIKTTTDGYYIDISKLAKGRKNDPGARLGL